MKTKSKIGIGILAGYAALCGLNYLVNNKQGTETTLDGYRSDFVRKANPFGYTEYMHMTGPNDFDVDVAVRYVPFAERTLFDGFAGPKDGVVDGIAVDMFLWRNWAFRSRDYDVLKDQFDKADIQLKETKEQLEIN